jgi:hypothetical protein
MQCVELIYVSYLSVLYIATPSALYHHPCIHYFRYNEAGYDDTAPAEEAVDAANISGYYSRSFLPSVPPYFRPLLTTYVRFVFPLAYLPSFLIAYFPSFLPSFPPFLPTFFPSYLPANPLISIPISTSILTPPPLVVIHGTILMVCS